MPEPRESNKRDWRACDHAGTQLPSRPIPDWTGACPDCGQRVTHGRGGLITIYENNAYAENLRPGQVWAMPDGTMVRIEDVRMMATFSPIGDTAAPLMSMDADAVKQGRPVLDENGRWAGA